jgi:hypothetical protein
MTHVDGLQKQNDPRLLRSVYRTWRNEPALISAPVFQKENCANQQELGRQSPEGE